MVAPLPASLLRNGACLLPITLERCLFSKITITMWSGGEAPNGFFGEERAGVDLGLFGENGRSTVLSFSGAGGTAAAVPLG